MAGQGGELKLLGTFSSPFVLRVKLALSFKGLSFENLEEKDLHNNKSELLLKSNPVHKKVPVLFHNGKQPICEFMVIVQYIDEAFAGVGPSLLPSDTHERAVARFWAAYIDEKLYSSWMMVYKGKTDEDEAEGTKQSFAVVATLEGALRKCSKGKPFFGGDDAGYVDIALGGLRRVGARHRGAVWTEAVRRRQDPAPGGVTGALRCPGRGQGSHAGRGEACRARQNEAGPSSSRRRRRCSGPRQLIFAWTYLCLVSEIRHGCFASYSVCDYR